MMANPLNIEFSAFSKDCIPDPTVREPLNGLAAKLQGIAAISQILEANDTERVAQGKDAEALDSILTAGLFAALVQLSIDADRQAHSLGQALESQNEPGRRAKHEDPA